MVYAEDLRGQAPGSSGFADYSGSVPSMTFLRPSSIQERIATGYSAPRDTAYPQDTLLGGNTPAHPLRW
jgi:hypothetical protein